MTIDEAIRHASEVACMMDCAACAAEHAKLAEWLKELKTLKNERNELISSMRDIAEACANPFGKDARAARRIARTALAKAGVSMRKQGCKSNSQLQETRVLTEKKE